MNKMAKGALAIGVGAALLLGGGGTLATWNGTANASAGTIASGDLALAATTAGKWQAGSNPAATAAALTSGFKAVPGDVYSFTQSLTVTLSGTNMVADLTTNTAVTKAFGDEATIAVSYSKDGATWTPAAQTLTTSGTIQARITVTFVDKGVGQNIVASSANKNADLNAIGFKLEQRVVTPAP